MAEAGLASQFPMQELAVMGLAEILPRILPLRRRIKETIAASIAAIAGSASAGSTIATLPETDSRKSQE